MALLRLIGEMDADARDLLRFERGSLGADGHESLHARIGAAGRQLRTLRADVPIHAAGVLDPAGLATLISGVSGAGKSTLAGLLAHRRGWGLISDDTVWVGRRRARGFGAPVSVRAGSPVWQVAQEAAGMPEGHRVLVLPSDLGSFRVESAEVGAIVIAAYGHDVPACRAIGSATAFAQLIGSLLRPPTDDDLHQLIELVSHAAASVIEFSDEESALQMFDRARAGGQMLSIGESIAREELDRAGFHAVVRGARFDDEVVLWQTHLGNIIQIRGWMGDGYAGMAIEPRLRGFGLLSNG